MDVQGQAKTKRISRLCSFNIFWLSIDFLPSRNHMFTTFLSWKRRPFVIIKRPPPNIYYYYNNFSFKTHYIIDPSMINPHMERRWKNQIISVAFRQVYMLLICNSHIHCMKYNAFQSRQYMDIFPRTPCSTMYTIVSWLLAPASTEVIIY